MGAAYPTTFAFGRNRQTNVTFWLAAGRTNSSNTSTGIIWFSTDGTSWSTHTHNLTLDQDSRPLRQLEYVNGKFFFAYGLGLFVSTDGVGWRKIVTPSLNSGTDPFSYPYLGNPIAFAISPFEEYYAIGGLTENATNPVPEFAYSNDFGNSWTTPTQSIPFSQPGLGDQVVHSISFGAGQFVITGGTELRCGGNCGPAANRTLNTVSTARGPSTFQGLGKAFFHYIDGSPPRQARDSVYSERLGIFVLCGSPGSANSSMVWSINPSVNDLRPGAGEMFSFLCNKVKTKRDVFSTVSGVALGVDGLSQVVPRSSSLRVPGSYAIRNGDFKSGGTTTFERAANFSSSGSIYFSGTTRILSGAQLVANLGAVVFPSSSVLEVEISAPGNVTNVTVPLFSYNFSIGSFLLARSINTFDTCTVLGTPVVSFSSSTASALISVNSAPCFAQPGQTSQSEQLSTGAIVGIAVGAAVGAVTLTIGIVFLMKYLISRNEATMRSDIKAKELSNLGR